ncbi:mannose-1-phosphate guanylyltransferase [Tessaracoccus flavus]|uniref:Mannose-1-phosphate guanylyltransferase n=1 Tax=Tessaracoccus flavus TaxID=1610493 RepID=A0A1Q2CFW0_9ACTN|nr:sugar phosphate nucleotidyltransferase [Tessaracoccus flavus]AQP45012.1 mannose-1-phosphate guanylyltransferase [Tessaracoccus flavus]SDY59355.1 mannose-1-phosphate guanylyltransferase (GDP) [Tessaracoccus flavus]
MRYVVIMAGGSGTRLWPLSRQGRPKQLLGLFEGKSLLRLAFERLDGLVPPDRILVCTGRAYADDVADQLPELSPVNILGEPEGRDSLNAVAWSAAVVADRDPDAVVAMVTADQVISPVDEFQRSLTLAFEVAEQRPSALVTLGVVPTSAHTGYGYLHRAELLTGFDGVYHVAEFKEKPERDVAQRYLDSGEYWWNAGMFVWRAATLLGQLDQLLPATAQTVREIVARPDRLDELFPTLQKISVDYAVMEPVSQGRTDAEVVSVGLAIDWRDVGGFVSLAELLSRDAGGNAVDGRTVSLDSRGCVVVNAVGPDHVVATLGLTDCLVVATPHATMVANLDDAERVRQLVDLVRTEAGPEFA